MVSEADGRARLLAPLEDVLTEGEVTIEENNEDVEPRKHVPSPSQPSVDQVERHRADHQPYRSRCKRCVMGRGLGFQHQSVSTKSSVPRVGVDYFFIASGGVKKRDELDVALTPGARSSWRRDALTARWSSA